MQQQLLVLKDQIINKIIYQEIEDHFINIIDDFYALIQRVPHSAATRSVEISAFSERVAALVTTHTESTWTEISSNKYYLEQYRMIMVWKNEFDTRATALIALAMITLLNPTPPTTVTRQRIMLTKTDTLRNIRRGQDYTTHRNTTLDLIAEWWTANPHATPTAGDDTFTSAAYETELFLEMCDVFDAENDTTAATSAFADRARDFDSVTGITASLATSSFVTNISRRSRVSYASHPEAAQFFTR